MLLSGIMFQNDVSVQKSGKAHLLSLAKLHSLNYVQQIAWGEYRRLCRHVNIILFSKIILTLRWIIEAIASDVK